MNCRVVVLLHVLRYVLNLAPDDRVEVPVLLIHISLISRSCRLELLEVIHELRYRDYLPLAALVNGVDQGVSLFGNVSDPYELLLKLRHGESAL